MADKNLKSITFPGLSDRYVIPQVDSTLTQTGRPADAKVTGDEFKKSILTMDEIPDTTQEYTFGSDGSVSQVVHKRNNAAYRTDAFTYGSGTITEVRTLASGESLTIATSLTTLETTVTYAAA